MEILRQTKDRNFELVRVDSIEILEQGSGREFGNMRGEDKVYNIQVERNGNYFANGVLVSNCHYLKNHNSGRSKAVHKLLKESGYPRLTMLTGTPVTNRINDMFNYLKMSKHPLGNNYDKFKNLYAVTAKVRGETITGAKNIPDLKGKISNLMIRLRSEDCLDLPPMVIKKYYFEPNDLSTEYEIELQGLRDKKQKYDSLHGVEKQKMRTEIRGNIHTLNRLVSTSKVNPIKELVDKLTDIGEKVIVFCGYTDPLDRLEELLGDSCIKINGSVNAHKRRTLIDKFKNDPECKVFLGNMQAAGIGINLVNARHVIFMNFPFTPDQIEQAQKRAHRSGQERRVFIYYTIAKETIDEHIYSLVIDKSSDINELIDGDHQGVTNYANIEGELFKRLIS
jgi:SNF2 family DNA or RNA helicase